jgi:hypothetical protein
MMISSSNNFGNDVDFFDASVGRTDCYYYLASSACLKRMRVSDDVFCF